MIHAQNGVQAMCLTPKNSSNETQTANINTLGADYATIRILLSARLNTNAATDSPVIALSEYDSTSSVATFGANFQRTISSTAAQCLVYHVDLSQRKQYIRLNVSTGSSSNDARVVGADVTLSRKGVTPTSSAAMAASSTLVPIVTAVDTIVVG